MSGSDTPKPLAARRSFSLRGVEKQTPILVPSFSSKGFPKISDLLKTSAELLDDTCLISAYDVYYRHLPRPRRSLTFTAYVFLDSGGYESARDSDLAEIGHVDHKPKAWSLPKYKEVLDSWPASVQCVAVSYDHPAHRVSLERQIADAEALFDGRSFARELLLKPEKAKDESVSTAKVKKLIHRLAPFDIVGFTEKELGQSPMERMRNIAAVRRAFDEAGLNKPIHIFGSLDTISCHMYFLAGADIFDGLTWLRMAFHDGMTLYRGNSALAHFPPDTSDRKSSAQILATNYFYLRTMTEEMCRFVNSSDFEEFKFHGELLKRLNSALMATS